MTATKTKKQCGKCEETLDITDFYTRPDSSDGYRSECKNCTMRQRLKRYAKNRVSVLAIKRQKYTIDKQPFLNAVNKWNKENPEKAKKHRDTYTKNNRLKENARRTFMKQLLKGTIIRQPCCVCKKIHKKYTEAEAHHSDYTKPLDVMWLCKPHHGAWHRLFLTEQQ